MSTFRALTFLFLAASALSAGAFVGGAISQPALFELLPWHQVGGQKS